MRRTLREVVRRSAPAEFVGEGDCTYETAQRLSQSAHDAACVLDADGALCGVVTVRDVIKSVARGCSLRSTAVHELMTRNPVTLSGESTPEDALQVMRKGGFRHVPVLERRGGGESDGDAGHDVLGVVDAMQLAYDAILSMQNNLILTRRAWWSFRATTQALQPTIDSLCLSSGAVVRSDVSVRHACELMVLRQLSALAVVEPPCAGSAPRLRGVFTGRDLIRRVLLPSLEPDELPVGAAMSADPEFVAPQETLLQALQSMQARGFRHLPVVDADDTVRGIVDVLHVSADALLPRGDDAGSARSAASSSTWSFFSPFAAAAASPPAIGAAKGASPRAPPPAVSRQNDAGLANAAVDADGAAPLVFKFRDRHGDHRRVKLPTAAPTRRGGAYDRLWLEVRRRYYGDDAPPAAARSTPLRILYADEDGDDVVIAGDDDLFECISAMRSLGRGVVRGRVDAAAPARGDDTRPLALPLTVGSAAASSPSVSVAGSESHADTELRDDVPACGVGPPPLLRRAMELLQSGDAAAAVRLYDEVVLTCGGGDARLHCQRAAARLILHDTDGAEADYRRALELADTDHRHQRTEDADDVADMCRCGLSEVLVEQRRYEEAGACSAMLRRQAARDDVAQALYEELAVCTSAAKRLRAASPPRGVLDAGAPPADEEISDALTLLTSAIRVDCVLEEHFLKPRDASLHCMRAHCYDALDDQPSAAHDYEAALRIDPDNYAAMYGHARCLRALDRLSDAKAAFERCMASRPDDEHIRADYEQLRQQLAQRDRRKIADLSAKLQGMF